MLAVNESPSMRVRIMAALLLTMGLIGMHHLIAIGCASFGSASHDVHVAVSEGSTQSTTEAADVAPVAESRSDAGATCLAIVLTFVFAAVVRGWLMQRHRMSGGTRASEPLRSHERGPPDLHILSVSRT